MQSQEQRRKNNPRKHHFLPASYLSNFSNTDGTLYIYERGKSPRASAPHAVACIRDFYAYDSGDGKAFEIEEILSRHESQAAPVLKGIVDREANGESRLLTNNENEIVAHFAALTFVRGPAGRRLNEEHIAPAVKRLFEQAAPDPQKFATLLQDVPYEEPLSAEERGTLVEDARIRILNGYFDHPEPPGLRLYAMLHVASMIADELRKYACMIVVAPKHEEFITGDTPVVNLTEENGTTQLGTAFDSPKNSVWFPIASKVCLVWHRDSGASYGKLPPRGVRMVNRNVMRYAERFIYSPKQSDKLATRLSRIKQEIFMGKNAYIPMWEGKPILNPE